MKIKVFNSQCGYTEQTVFFEYELMDTANISANIKRASRLINSDSKVNVKVLGNAPFDYSSYKDVQKASDVLRKANILMVSDGYFNKRGGRLAVYLYPNQLIDLMEASGANKNYVECYNALKEVGANEKIFCGGESVAPINLRNTISTFNGLNSIVASMFEDVSKSMYEDEYGTHSKIPESLSGMIHYFHGLTINYEKNCIKCSSPYGSYDPNQSLIARYVQCDDDNPIVISSTDMYTLIGLSDRRYERDNVRADNYPALVDFLKTVETNLAEKVAFEKNLEDKETLFRVILAMMEARKKFDVRHCEAHSERFRMALAAKGISTETFSGHFSVWGLCYKIGIQMPDDIFKGLIDTSSVERKCDEVIKDTSITNEQKKEWLIKMREVIDAKIESI